MPFALEQVGAVDPGGDDLEQHLVGGGDRVGDLGEDEGFGPARHGNGDSAHASNLSSLPVP